MNALTYNHQNDCGCGREAGVHSVWRSLISCLILALWGGVMIYFYHSGRIDHYLSTEGPFRTQCLLAGYGLLLLASANMWFTLRWVLPHVHSTPASAIARGFGTAVLVVPVSLAALRSPDRYSDRFFLLKVHASPVASVQTTSATDAFTVAELVRLCGGRTANGDIPLGLEQVFQIASQPEDVRGVVESVSIETMGQLVRDPADPTCWRLSRLRITCCAADAQAVSVLLRCHSESPDLMQLGWYKAVGRVEEIEKDGVRTPVFRAVSMTMVEPPRNLMLY